jgi:hypothetical protein
MPWIDEALDLLVKSPVCGYTAQDQGATEPSALAALALVGHRRKEAAAGVGEFLLGIQEPSGSVGVRSGEETPRWPTSLAILAWLAMDKATYSDSIARAFRWAVSIEGERLETGEVSHNGMLAAWPWVEKGNVAGPRGTHSWLEPSALFVIAFKALGMSDHVRTREAVELLIDRILPEGGCNYGNTFVLGQKLRPHVQPSGMAMLALRNEFDVRRKIGLTLDYLARSVTSEVTAASLAWALLGLAAHDRVPLDADKLLERSFERTISRDKSPHKVALLALAALGKDAPLIALQEDA